ncbi:MAG: hypothetical protein ACFWUA_10030 [Sporanaerobacter sp.]|uniref:PilW family protein n=1 Tax=Sporanaerobacter sp. TaxID=2010183 RepID=UPI003A0FEADD
MNNKGITLIELLLSLAFMMAIVGLIFNIYIMSKRVFNASVEQSFTQKNSRLVSDFIIKELRNAKVIEMDENNIKNKGNRYYCLSIKNDGYNNYLAKQTIENGEIISENQYGNNLENIIFMSTEEKEIMKVIVISKEKEKEFEIEFEFLLNNIDKLNVNIEGSNRIYYLKR